mgnify:CR=1 FL=1
MKKSITLYIMIGLLAGIVAPQYFAQIGKSNTKVARAQIESFGQALDQYRLDVGQYPSTEQGLLALRAAHPALHAGELRLWDEARTLPTVLGYQRRADGRALDVLINCQDGEGSCELGPRAGQVLGNLNTLIMLRVKELATAELLTAQLPMCEITSLVPASGAHDTAADGGDAHFTSANQDLVTKSREPLLTPHELVTLPKGQAFCLLEGGQLWKVRLPLPDASADPAMPAGLAQIAADMARRYRTGEAWWQQEESTGIVPLPDAPAAGPDDQQSTPAGIPEQPASLASRGRAAASAEAALMDGANGARGV